MTTYRRPAIAAVGFRDPEGRVIDYGNPWGGYPPEDTYSVDTHPERFTPLHSFHYPHCGCDACDESWESQADELESDVLAVAEGGYQESVQLGRKPCAGYSITTRHGGRSTQGANDVPLDRLRAAEPVLRTLGGTWALWPGRG